LTSTLSLPFCQSRLLLEIPNLVHGVTRRVEGLGKAHGNLGYTAPRDREDAREMRRLWSQSLGIDPGHLRGIHQVHGADACVVRHEHPEPHAVPKADAMLTAERELALLTLHADCMPIILCDPIAPAIASIHAGWRGTTLEIAGKTVARMVDELGARPERMTAFLGPAIGGCCYQVGVDVYDAWNAIPGAHRAGAIRPAGERWLLDLEIANRWLLRRAGIPDARIESSGVCTKCGGDDWFSHRGQGALTGRYGSIVALV
jgi:YfiH family protein